MIGTTVAHYRVLSPLGAGGMGEVYRATDTKLGREVAIKVLPAEVAGDPERLLRFEREAKLLASLNHPNIAHVYGFENATLPEGSAIHFLAMELVEGEDLAERLKRGPIPVDEAIAIASQIAEALEEAHEHGIVHRDLKPANVKVTPDGKVKVLDFGLAKAYAGEVGTTSSADLSRSPTLAHTGTQAGVILGTAAYMSPEQARGKAVDKRSDIWAFGVVLLEMLTGRPLFTGETVSDVLAAVLTRDPVWTSLPAATTPRLRGLLERCLTRDAKQRLRDIGEARVELSRIASGAPEAGSGAIGVASATRGASPRRIVVWAAGVIAVLAVTVLAALALVRRDGSGHSVPQPLTAFGVLVPEGQYLPRSQSPLLDIAADGRTLVFAAEGKGPARVFLRSFDRLEVRQVPGTEGAEQPCLSPDGRWIAFFAGGMLRKIPVEGGTAVSLAEARAPRGASWTPDGSLVFSPVFNSALWRVAATGGEPSEITRIDAAREERSHRWPVVLPDGKTVLFTVGVASRPGDYDDGRIDAVRLDTGERRTVLEGARMARYSATGHIVFQRRQALLAVRFDPARLVTLSEPFSIQEGAGGETSSGAGYFAVSTTGVLAFAPESAIPNERTLVLADRQGRETEISVSAAAYNNPRFSPDGRRLVLGVGSANAADDDVFLLEISSQRLQRLTFGQGHGLPLWSPDGHTVVYTKGRSGDTGLARRSADGSGAEVLIRRNAGNAYIANSWLPDGRRLAVTDTAGTFDVRLLDLDEGSIEPLLADAGTAEYAPAFSPDGRFLAYTSTETGVDEVFVETFPAGGGKWQVSNGGACPVWSRDGRELFYTADEAIMAVDVDTNGVLRPGTPRRLFGGPYELRTMPLRNYDVGPDGRFALIKRRFVSATPREIVVLSGWMGLDPSLEPAR